MADTHPHASSIRTIAIISGVRNEIAAFLPDIPGTELAIAGLYAVEKQWHGKRILLGHAGLGKVAAGMAAALLNAHSPVDLFLIIGTAGALSDTPGQTFLITEAVQSDYGARRPEAFIHYTAGSLPIGTAHVEPFRAMTLPDIGLPTARVATADCFIESAEHAAHLRDVLGASIVDMETAALAQVAMMLGKPWAGIKSTTDNANDSSADHFAINLEAAARSAAEAAERLIAAL